MLQLVSIFQLVSFFFFFFFNIYLFFLKKRDAAGLNDNDMGSFVKNLGKLGFVWQFITLGGLHANALATCK